MKTIFVTNIPTPYRVSMWNRLQSIVSEDGRFSVFFMNRSEPDRKWEIDEKMKFSYHQWDMHLFYIKKIPFRFNLRFCLKAIRESDHIVLGASWNDLNVILIVLLKRLGLIKNTISFWTEANRLTLGARRSSAIKSHFRRWVLSGADGIYLIPGRMTELTLIDWGISPDANFINFPNMPHEKFDIDVVGNQRSFNELPVLTIVARLDEQLKGILNFMQAVGPLRLKSVHLNIIGSGPSRKLYEDYIASNGLSENVTLLGERKVEEVVDILLQSDVFVLPSFSDQSPLSVIEALKLGLPLLISLQCGNHYECLEPDRNGFGFFPEHPHEISAAFDSMMMNRGKWPKYSQRSLEIASLKHDSNANIRKLAEII